MKNVSLGSIFKPIGMLLGRFHLTIFIVLIVAGLVGAVMLLNSVLADDSVDDGYTSSIGGGTIDQATLERIQSLHTSGEPLPAFTPPSGRINPFAE